MLHKSNIGISPDAKDSSPAISITHCERCHVRKLLDLVSSRSSTELTTGYLCSGENWLQYLLVSSLSRDMGLHTVDL
jgi:hypothetical protein